MSTLCLVIEQLVSALVYFLFIMQQCFNILQVFHRIKEFHPKP